MLPHVSAAAGNRTVRRPFILTAYQIEEQPTPRRPIDQDAAVLSRAGGLLKQLGDNADTAVAWNSVFQQGELSGPALAEVFVRLHSGKRYEAAVQGIQAAIRHDHAQPWMYDVLALEMKLAGRPQRDIDRALLSRIDFAAGDPAQLLVTAALLARFDAWDQAIAMCREVIDRDPFQREPWMLAKRFADRGKVAEHILWSRVGILKYVWSDDFEIQHAEARTTLDDLRRSLESRGNSDVADKVREALEQALSRDLRIRVEWAGDGDVDLIVREPGNQTCSFRNRRTTNGGVMILTDDDTSATRRGGRSAEEYLCREAPSGAYVVTLRLATGKVITGNAVVSVTKYENTPAEKKTRLRVAVGRKDADVKVQLNHGRGTLPD